MNYLFTVGQILVKYSEIIIHEESFTKDLKKICKKYKTFRNDLAISEKMLFEKFINNADFSVNGKIHQIKALSEETPGIGIWKIEAMCQGVKPNLWPRIWFLLNREYIHLLLARIHSDNYDNNTVDREASKIAKDIIDS